MEVITGRKLTKPSPSNRVTIYTLATARDVQALIDPKSKTLQGFYIPRAGGSVAFVQDLRSIGRDRAAGESSPSARPWSARSNTPSAPVTTFVLDAGWPISASAPQRVCVSST